MVPRGRGIGLPERLEDVRQKRRVDADAGVVTTIESSSIVVWRQRHGDAPGVA